MSNKTVENKDINISKALYELHLWGTEAHVEISFGCIFLHEHSF
jgi:hypothetical protein